MSATSLPTPHTSQQRTWQLFVEAKKKLIEAYEKPVHVKAAFTQASKGSLTLELVQEDTREPFYTLLGSTFNLAKDDVDKAQGAFYLDWDTSVDAERLRSFKSIAAGYSFDFEFNPYLEGSIDCVSEARKSFEQFLQGFGSVLKERRGAYTFQFPVEHWEQLRQWTATSEGIKVPDDFGVILSYHHNFESAIKAEMGDAGIESRMQLLSAEYRKGSDSLEVAVRNLGLKEKRLLNFFNARGLTLVNVEVTILARQQDGAIIKTTKAFAEIFEAELHCEFVLRRKAGFITTKFYDVVYRLKADSIADNSWAAEAFGLARLYSSIDFLHNPQLNTSTQSLYYECGGVEEFHASIAALKASSLIGINYSQQGFRVKGKVEIDSPLAVLRAEMHKAFPATALDAAVSADAARLEFRYFLDFKERFQRNLVFRNFLEELSASTPYRANLASSPRLKFLARENREAKALPLAERLQKVLREEFMVGKGAGQRSLGTLKKVAFPLLYFTLPDDMTEGELSALLDDTLAGDDVFIAANLSGEREKIARLNTALGKLASAKAHLPNPASRKFFFDSSQAVALSTPEELLKGSETWNELVEHSLLNLNDSQVNAVISTLLAKDLALVQGPPGTGKSSAISQIIWHHIRREQRQRILLTSETNMAVDNAIEKLENDHGNIVKPLRIGKEERLEKEGSRYSLTKIERWQNSDSMDTESDLSDNAVQKWMRNISARASKGVLPQHLLARWQSALTNPRRTIKQDFATEYLAHVNVVASTGSAIGDVSTKGRWTSFYQQYLQVFDRLNYERFVGRQRDAINIKRIAFDVVIMDEASKATPPEVALVLVYAKKLVLIGDHRQLPPMLDEGDFKSTLIGIGERKLAAEFTREDAETSHFERLFTNPALHPSLVSRFNTQYRMHPHINDVIQQFYLADGGLHCGITPDDADDPNLLNPGSRYHGFDLPGFIEPDKHLLWVEVDEPEMADLTSRVNWAEVHAVRAVLKCLEKAAGFKEFQQSRSKAEEKEVGIITFYGRQRLLLEGVAEEFEKSVPTRVRTVDKFQGMERNVVIVSTVRSNKLAASRFQAPDLVSYPDNGGYPVQSSLGFAEFPNRLNVALSRAKRLLVIVGNSQHFSQNDCYQRVYEKVCEVGTVIDYKRLIEIAG